MGATVQLAGTLTLGPTVDGGFPGSQGSVDIGNAGGSCGGIPAGVTTGFQARKMLGTSPTYLALDVGTGKSVSLALFLYLRTRDNTNVRLTTVGPSGDVVAVVPVNGLMMLTFPTGKELKLLEVDGTGTVEYMAAGTV